MQINDSSFKSRPNFPLRSSFMTVRHLLLNSLWFHTVMILILSVELPTAFGAFPFHLSTFSNAFSNFCSNFLIASRLQQFLCIRSCSHNDPSHSSLPGFGTISFHPSPLAQVRRDAASPASSPWMVRIKSKNPLIPPTSSTSGTPSA